ncbi:MAG: DNA-binding response regulator [Microbacterium sp.]|jgi:DNA-binding NarL/FixJ family response regulator|nr:DNA-binding response regulator [Microbacterium sp.]
MIDVLIVDDQALARLGNSLVVESAADLRVVGEAATGEEGIALARTLHPDVILMDVRMPGMGGISATHAITSASPTTRIVVLTSFDLDQYAFGALESGASAFLLKSAAPERLIDAIRTVHRGDAVVEPHITQKLIHRALRSADETPASRPIDMPAELSVLSPREQDVFLAMATGMTNAEISERLFLSPATVKSHINKIFSKLTLRDRVHAVILAHRLKITGS